ncbi:MAG: hypothetical protein ACXU84_19770 [Xanthobacteraceae bacterium]
MAVAAACPRVASAAKARGTALHPVRRGERMCSKGVDAGPSRATAAAARRSAMSAAAKSIAAITLAALSAVSSADAQIRPPHAALDWQTFVVPEFGTTVEYPASIFSVPGGKAEKGLGQRFTSADGRSVLTIYSRENAAGDTPASYLRNNLRMGRAGLDYERVTRSFFAISSERQGMILYSRCNFSTDAGGAIHCFDLVYPQEEKRAWDPVVTRISRSLRPLEG